MSVYRMASDGPELIGLLGQELEFMLRVDTPTDSLTSPLTDVGPNGVQLSGVTRGALDGPEPQHFGGIVYRWNGSSFDAADVEEAYTSQPILHEGLPDGEYAVYVRAGQPNEVFINVVTLISGQDAVDYCIEQGARRAEAVFCGESFYTEPVADDLVRALRVAPAAIIPYQLDDYDSSVPTTAADLGNMPATAYDDPAGTTFPWTFTVRGGDVVRLEQFFAI